MSHDPANYRQFRLKGSNALVTGASRGLGRSVAVKLAQAGANIALNYCSNQDLAEQAAQQIRDQCGVKAFAVKADMGSEADIIAMIKEVVHTFGGLEVLVNNAAVCPHGWVQDSSTEAWEEVLRINLTGPFIACREMLNHLLPTGKPGRIVNVSSPAAFHASTSGQAAYDVSKGGLNSLTMALTREVSHRGVIVNAVAPGLMLTEMAREKFLANKEKYLARVAMDRFAETGEVADAVVFACSEGASYMSGTVMNVSGGLLFR